MKRIVEGKQMEEEEENEKEESTHGFEYVITSLATIRKEKGSKDFFLIMTLFPTSFQRNL